MSVIINHKYHSYAVNVDYVSAAHLLFCFCTHMFEINHSIIQLQNVFFWFILFHSCLIILFIAFKWSILSDLKLFSIFILMFLCITHEWCTTQETSAALFFWLWFWTLCSDPCPHYVIISTLSLVWWPHVMWGCFWKWSHRGVAR